jgi:hypothetical protein
MKASRRHRVGVLYAYASCAAVALWLLARRELPLPRRHVDLRLTFADGTCSRVYRETVRRGAPTSNPSLLVVQFQLRLLGRNPVLHALFRLESLANTLLFAGFPGFRSKLWLTDERTWVYRGVYEWDDPQLATEYATTLSALLHLVCRPDSVCFHVEPGVRRDDFLRDPGIVGSDEAPPSERWWQLHQGIPV